MEEGKQQPSQQSHICQIRLPLPEALKDASNRRRVENIRNCDIFVEDFSVHIYADVGLLSYNAARRLDVKDMKNVVINYKSKERYFELELPCLPESSEEADEHQQSHTEKGQLEQRKCHQRFDLWKLQRITDNCQLRIDDRTDLLKFEANFDYGFACKNKGRVQSGESDLSIISHMPDPHLRSPLQRSIDREIDELKDFSREQYKLNFVDLQVPEGHDNPMHYSINFSDTKLSREEECQLHNLTRKDDFRMPDTYDQAEVDCGLISILLGICYDVRSTGNEPTCESAWTRSILTPTLSYFESFENLKNVVISFLRRSLIYPLYRNYEFGRLCVQDAIDALRRNRAWLLKQLLVTHDLFVSSENSREVFNRYYIEDYIRYIHSEIICPTSHLQMLAHNLKNVLLDVYKKHLLLDLAEIEKELLKELITDIHISGASTSEEDSELDDTGSGIDDDDEDDDDESTEDDTETSESEENSVIEQCSNASKP